MYIVQPGQDYPDMDPLGRPLGQQPNPNQGGLASIQKALQPLNQATRKLPMHLALLMARQRQQMPPNLDDPMQQPQIPKDLLTGEPPVLDPVGPPNDIFPPPRPPGMPPEPHPMPGSPFPGGMPFQRPPWSDINTTMPTFPGQLSPDKLKDFLGSLTGGAMDMFNRSGGMPQPVAGLPSLFQ